MFDVSSPYSIEDPPLWTPLVAHADRHQAFAVVRGTCLNYGQGRHKLPQYTLPFANCSNFLHLEVGQLQDTGGTFAGGSGTCCRTAAKITCARPPRNNSPTVGKETTDAVVGATTSRERRSTRRPWVLTTRTACATATPVTDYTPTTSTCNSNTLVTTPPIPTNSIPMLPRRLPRPYRPPLLTLRSRPPSSPALPWLCVKVPCIPLTKQIRWRHCFTSGAVDGSTRSDGMPVCATQPPFPAIASPPRSPPLASGSTTTTPSPTPLYGSKLSSDKLPSFSHDDTTFVPHKHPLLLHGLVLPG